MYTCKNTPRKKNIFSTDPRQRTPPPNPDRATLTAAGCPSAAMSTPLAVSVGCGGGEDGEVAAPPTVAAAADDGDESAGTGGGGVCGEAVLGVADAGGRAGAELLPRRRFPWDDAPEYGKFFSLILFPFVCAFFRFLR